MSLVTITNTKENTLEFDLGIEGIASSDARVRFVVLTGEMAISFDAKKESGNTWSVAVPPLTSLAKTAYNYRIEVVVDGYYFEPTTGILNVVGSHDLYSTTPKNTTLTPKEKEEPKVEKPEAEKKVEEGKKESKKSSLLKTLTNVSEEASTPANSADEKVRAILKETAQSKRVVTTSIPAFKKLEKLH